MYNATTDIMLLWFLASYNQTILSQINLFLVGLYSEFKAIEYWVCN
jgi:hypothetical protein